MKKVVLLVLLLVALAATWGADPYGKAHESFKGTVLPSLTAIAKQEKLPVIRKLPDTFADSFNLEIAVRALDKKGKVCLKMQTSRLTRNDVERMVKYHFRYDGKEAEKIRNLRTLFLQLGPKQNQAIGRNKTGNVWSWAPNRRPAANLNGQPAKCQIEFNKKGLITRVRVIKYFYD